jgi:hypothetical protein
MRTSQQLDFAVGSIVPRDHSCSQWAGLFDVGKPTSDSDHTFDSIYMYLADLQVTFSMLYRRGSAISARGEAVIFTSIAAKVTTAFMVAS